MNEHETHEDQVSRRELLISRLIDASAEGLAPDDAGVRASWEALRALAERDATLWQDLARAQYQHAALKGEVDAELSVVHRVDLPAASGAAARAAHRREAARRGGWSLALGSAGWLAAAALALTWFVVPSMVSPAHDEVDGTIADVSTGRHVETPDEAIEAYLAFGGKDGRVLGEVPDRSVVQWRRRPSDGKIEAIVRRSFLERDILDDVYTVGQDELGRSVAVPVSYSPGASR